jgi:hypothetical protein
MGREGRGLKRLLLLLTFLPLFIGFGFGFWFGFGFGLFPENWFGFSRLLLRLWLLLASEESKHELLLGRIGVHLEGL